MNRISCVIALVENAQRARNRRAKVRVSYRIGWTAVINAVFWNNYVHLYRDAYAWRFNARDFVLFIENPNVFMLRMSGHFSSNVLSTICSTAACVGMLRKQCKIHQKYQIYVFVN